MNEKLLATVRFYFAQSVFMESCHYKAYERLGKMQNISRYLVLSLASATLIVIILQLIGLELTLPNLLDILILCGLVLTASSLIFQLFNKEDLSEIKNHHKGIAEEYKSLRDVYMSLIEEIMSNSYDEVILRTKRDDYLLKYSSVGRFAPKTTYKDYINTQNGLGLIGSSEEEFTWSNEEIDRFLPSELRLKK